MKNSILVFLFLSSLHLPAQVGIRAGLNFANITKASAIGNSSRSGFNAGLFLSPSSKGIISSRTEFIFSRQGYDFKTSSSSGSVNLNYIMLPQMLSVNITKYFSVLLGGHMAYLLNAKVDSTQSSGTGNPGVDRVLNLYNRFDYGYGGGVEVHPVSGVLIGARVNISLGNLYKTPEPGEQPSFIPKVNVKNNLFQLYAGWRFGKRESSKR